MGDEAKIRFRQQERADRLALRRLEELQRRQKEKDDAHKSKATKKSSKDAQESSKSKVVPCPTVRVTGNVGKVDKIGTLNHKTAAVDDDVASTTASSICP